jgi:hypothetical protein
MRSPYQGGAMPVFTPRSAPVTGDLGAYPSVPITLTDSEIQIATDQIPAGYVRLTVSNTGQNPNGIGLFEIPGGQSMRGPAPALNVANRQPRRRFGNGERTALTPRGTRCAGMRKSLGTQNDYADACHPPMQS